MTFIRNLLPALAAGIFVSACSGLPIKEATDQLKTKPICCTSYSELESEPLSAGQRRKVDLDASSLIMDFPEGRSYVKSLSLPTNARSLAIQSIYTAYLPKTTYVDPILIILNSDKKPIARFGELDLRRTYDTFLGFREWYFGCRVSLPTDSAYLIVYANNKSRRVLQTISENGTPWPAPPAPIGTLGLTAE